MIGLILLAVVGHVSGSALCPDNWLAYQGSCYLFAYGQKLSFVEAEHFCNQREGRLVEVNDVHENHVLLNYVRHQKPINWWIGLNDQDVENEYRWLHSNATLTFTFWGSGEPDHHHESHDCIEMSPGNNYHWNDVPCSSQLSPICERRTTAIKPTGFNAIIG